MAYLSYCLVRALPTAGLILLIRKLVGVNRCTLFEVRFDTVAVVIKAHESCVEKTWARRVTLTDGIATHDNGHPDQSCSVQLTHNWAMYSIFLVSALILLIKQDD